MIFSLLTPNYILKLPAKKMCWGLLLLMMGGMGLMGLMGGMGLMGSMGLKIKNLNDNFFMR